MNKQKSNTTSTNRRSFLKRGAVAIGASGLSYTAIDSSTAQDTNLSLGQKQFIEAVIEYDVPDDRPLGEGDGLPNYLIDHQRDIVGVVQYPKVEKFIESDTILTNGRSFSIGIPSSIYGNKTAIIDRMTNYNRTIQKSLYLNEEIRQPEIKIQSANEDIVEGKVGDTHFSIESKQETSITLSTRRVEISKVSVENPMPDELVTETIRITPKINIRNNGTLHLFGSNDTYVIPVGSENQTAQTMVGARGQAPNSNIHKTDGISSVKESDLLIIENKGDQNG